MIKYVKSIVVASFVAIATVISYAVIPVSHTAALTSSGSLSIVPTKNYVIQPGATTKDTLVISNLDTILPLQLTLRVIDFTFTDDSGTPKLILDPNAPQTTWSLKPFLTVPKSVTIPAGGTKTLDMSVSIPAGHGAGSYYSAILYAAGSGQGGNVGLSASGVTLVFTTIPGKVNEDLKLEKFGAYLLQTQTTHPDYVSVTGTEPWSIAYTLKNNGNVTESPVGTITYKYMFGSTQTITNVNPTSSLALIGQTRTYNSCIKLQTQDVKLNGSVAPSTTCVSPGLWPGYYTTSLDLFYGQNGNRTQEITGTGSFWYLPIWFVITVLVVLLVIAFFVWRLVRRVRRFLYGPKSSSSFRRK